MSDFKTQEVAEFSKIFHLKLLIKKFLEFLKQNGAFIDTTKK